MADRGRHDDDGWQRARPANEIREEEQIEQWEKSEGHWSGLGKHPANFTDHKKLHLSQERDLGFGSYGVVERVTYGIVTMARKHVTPRRRVPLDKLREEANVMDRLAHKHILKLVGTYTGRRNDLYLLLYPAAVCDLSKFLEDIDEIRSGRYADHEDAYKRLRLLGLKDVDATTIAPAAASTPGRTATALGFLQQIMGCITEALVYVHDQDIRHRDLKPKNILLSPGRVYLADFGIARDVRESEDTITSGKCGTPSWNAPEVVDEIDHHMSKADVYSLGCIFLNIATLLHGDTLDSYDHVMKESDWEKKYERLRKHLKDLRLKVAAEELENEEAPTYNVKHILGLVERMLKYDPIERPTASEVNARLCEFGGLDQVYHLPCCHKKSAYVSQVINCKLRSLYEINAASAANLAQLEAENVRKQERINFLETVHGTWEQRIENEKKHAGKQYQALMEKYNNEVKQRKALEERVKALESERQNHGRGPFPFHNKKKNKSNFGINGARPLNGNGSAKGINQAPFFGQNGHGTVFHTETPQFPKWTSGIPMPVRPSTPIRPSLNRDPDSNTSTLRSSIHSTFSRTSLNTNESASSVSNATVRSLSPPPSPTRERQQDLSQSQILADLRSSTVINAKTSAKQKSSSGGENLVAPPVAKPSYAKAVAGHGAG